MTIGTQRWFMGGDGAVLRRGGVQGSQDGAEPIVLRARSNPLALAGIGGEAVFHNLYIALTRANEAEWTFTVTPVVDQVAQEPIDVVLLAAAAPVSEILELSLMQPFRDSLDVVRSTFAPRGQWFQLLLSAANAPDALVSFDGIEIEYDVEIEGRRATNAS